MFLKVFLGIRLMLKTKRVYDVPDPSDGYRILVDRVWPRGMTKEKAKADEWMRAIAPSDALRKWFAHDPSKWGEFKKRYSKELEGPGVRELAGQIAARAESGAVTLLFGARDTEHNQAMALKEFIEKIDKKKR